MQKIVLCFFLICFSCALSSHSKVLKNPTFEMLTGYWNEKRERWLKLSEEDELVLDQFAVNYEEKMEELSGVVSKEPRVPRLAHVIWVGPKEFPKESVENIAQWIRLHPSWKFLFWTDSASRPLPCPTMERHLINEINFTKLGGYLPLTENYGEQADMLRYEILYQWGGLYTDHDVYPYRNFERFLSRFDFVVGLENPHVNPGTKTQIFPCNCLIMAKPKHPIIKRTMELVDQRWNEIETLYPARDPDSTFARVMNRTFHSFTLATKECNNSQGNRDLILPTSFFFGYKIFPKTTLLRLKAQGLVVARHDFASVWRESEESHEAIFASEKSEKSAEETAFRKKAKKKESKKAKARLSKKARNPPKHRLKAA